MRREGKTISFSWKDEKPASSLVFFDPLMHPHPCANIADLICLTVQRVAERGGALGDSLLAKAEQAGP